MTKVLIVETNIQKYKSTNEATGLWLGESAEFVDELQKENIKIDYVSPNGGFVPLDPRSMKYIDESIMKIYESADFIERALMHTSKPSEINPKEYAAIYYTGGHGVMWDFPNNKEIQEIARSIYEDGGYLVSVCHGIAGLFNIKDSNNNYVITNKNITGFTTSEELIAGKKKIVPFLNQQIAKERNAHFKKARFYKDYAIQDDHIITGQNPFSVRSVAKLLIDKLK